MSGKSMVPDLAKEKHTFGINDNPLQIKQYTGSKLNNMYIINQQFFDPNNSIIIQIQQNNICWS